MFRKPSLLAWEGLVAYVVIVDAILLRRKKKNTEHYTQTLSSAFNQATNNKVNAVVLSSIWAILSFHLFKNLFPQSLRKYDLITFLGECIYKSI